MALISRQFRWPIYWNAHSSGWFEHAHWGYKSVFKTDTALNEWTNERTNERTHARTHERKNERTNERTCIYIPHISHGVPRRFTILTWVRSDVSMLRRLWLPLWVHIWSHSPTQPMHEMYNETMKLQIDHNTGNYVPYRTTLSFFLCRINYVSADRGRYSWTC